MIRRTILLAALLFALGGPLEGQVVRGRVLDAAGGLPVPLAEVSLVDEAGESVAEALANANGRFLLRAPRPGHHYLYAEGMGYLASFEGPLGLDRGDTLDVEIRLQAAPFAMDSILIRAEPRSPSMELVGFYERRALGLGTFIDREAIEERAPLQITDLFRTVPGVRVVPKGGGLGRNVLASRRMTTFSTGLLCLPNLFIDGIPSDPSEIDVLVDPMDVEAVEFYSGGAQTPAQYSGSEAACGVVLIWTRRGG